MKNENNIKNFRIYSEDDIKKIENQNITNTKKTSFRVRKFIVGNEIYYINLNVNICEQLKYCCDCILDKDRENYFFTIDVPKLENENVKYQNKIKKTHFDLSTKELIDKYNEIIKEKETINYKFKNHSDYKKRYERKSIVSTIAKKRAAGYCDLVDENNEKHKAPFSVNKIPYLECHHVNWLSKGGEDTIDNVVALCPNCHRKMHSLDNEKDVESLKSKINEYMIKEKSIT